MSKATPVTFTWEGDAMRPSTPFMSRMADEAFVIGERYRMVAEEERSGVSHRHFFASVNGAWENLPEHLAERFPTAEHLRRFALIKAGYCDTATFVASSKAEAERLAAFIKPTDEFQIVTVREATVTRYTAKSQSLRAMGKQDFQASKDAVLGIIAGMIGTEAEALDRARAA